MFDVCALGEMLIDFTQIGISDTGNAIFERNPGGAPANVLTAVTKLGGRGAFIGKVGNDTFGRYLKEVLIDNSIENSCLKFTYKANTTLAFVSIDDKGDRSFSFYRNPGADIMLEDTDIDYNLIDKSKIFHFGSLSLTDEPSRSTTIKAVEYAKNTGKIISYDPNWRPALWKNDASAKKGMMLGLKYADILKISAEELEFLTDKNELDRGSQTLLKLGIKLILVTLGQKGCYYKCASGFGHMETYDTNVIDTTGAGDAFMGGILYRISRYKENISDLKLSQIEEAIDFANAVGALCASKRGAIPSMPSLNEVIQCMKSTEKLYVE